MAHENEYKTPGKQIGPGEREAIDATTIPDDAVSGLSKDSLPVFQITEDSEFMYAGWSLPRGVIVKVSDHTKARLAHLEAIEAAMDTVDTEIRHRLPTWIKCETNELHDLIRKGMKDNE